MLWDWQHLSIYCLLQTEHCLYQQLWETLEAKLHHVWLTAPALLDIICLEKRFMLCQQVPSPPTHSRQHDWHNTMDRVTQGGLNFFPQASLCMSSSSSSCIQAAIWSFPRRYLATVQITTFIPESQLNSACTCNPYIHGGLFFVACCEWMAWREAYSSPHYMIYLKSGEQMLRQGWLNDGWYPQPAFLSPMRRHLCHSAKQYSS